MLPDEIVRSIHESLLCCNVVSFHTNRWREAFRSVCGALGLDVGHTLVTAHPISIDPDEFTALAASPPVLERERDLLDSRPETMILRVDRTDPAKNVPRGLQAFGLLLERRPELHGRVGMLALLDPSRQEIPEYIDERRRIEEAAAAVEARFPGALQLRIADDFHQSIAAYKQFDVLLVNAVMDGLNLVAKEAPYVNARDGVVVLSVNAGAYEEIGTWTVPVDPFDVEGPGGRARGRARACRGGASHTARLRSGSTSAATTSRGGSTPSFPTSTAPVRCASHERPLACR